MILVIGNVMSNGLQTAHVDNSLFFVEWVQFNPEDIEPWCIKMFEKYDIVKIIDKTLDKITFM